MPRFPVAVVPAVLGNFSASYIDRTGDKGTVSLEVEDTVDALELTNLSAMIGDVSNAGLVSYTTSVRTAIDPTQATAYDDAESKVETKAELVFMNGQLKTRSVSIPAPDSQYFAEDGKTVEKVGNMSALIDQIALVLNGGALGSGTYTYQRGYLVTRSRKASKPNVKPSFSEPLLLPPSDADGI